MVSVSISKKIGIKFLKKSIYKINDCFIIIPLFGESTYEPR